jgi:CopG family nickel-responsive transcriptional regulator
MERITVTLDTDLLERLDAMLAERRYASRSEALRDILREHFSRAPAASAEDAACVASLTYVYDHHTRDLAARLADAQHHRHDLTVATMHVHLDAEACLEVALLKGAAADVRAFADSVTSQRGVRFGHLHVVPAVIHSHGPDGAPHVHA